MNRAMLFFPGKVAYFWWGRVECEGACGSCGVGSNVRLR